MKTKERTGWLLGIIVVWLFNLITFISSHPPTMIDNWKAIHGWGLVSLLVCSGLLALWILVLFADED